MNAAELDLRRRALGLSVAEAAEILGAGERTLSYWSSGRGEPRDPDGIAVRLAEVENVMGDIVDDIVERADEEERAAIVLARPRTRAELDASGLGRGLPLGAYLMSLAWALDELRADGHTVSIDWSQQ